MLICAEGFIRRFAPFASKYVDFNPRLFYDNEIKKNKIEESEIANAKIAKINAQF